MKSKNWLKRGCLTLVVLCGVGLVGLYLAATAFPQIGAQGADSLRALIGDQAVAQLEMMIFQVQDSFDQVKFSLGMKNVSSPWQASGARTSVVRGTATPTPPPTFTPTVTLTPTPRPTDLPTLTPTLSPTSTLTPTATPWAPADAKPLGSLEGEAVWQPYMDDGAGHSVAYRTFIQPDPLRPYALVAAVAFDLTRVKLNFILGFEEPYAPDVPRRSGAIPTPDNKPGVLLATFNGAFKAQHGSYGAMSAGLTVIKPVKGFATVAIYENGDVKIGAWGKDFENADGMLAWRQNCSMIVEDGQINPLVDVDSAFHWGANLNGATTTWRSGIGVSADGRTLYYFAGPNMKMPILAQAMHAAGVQDGMQLDINNYWVHFVAVRNEKGKMVPEPLFPDDMKADVGRYLQPYARDFFYVALKQP